MFDLVLSLTVLCALALAAASIYLWRRGGNTRQAVLMAVLAFVMIANVAIWVMPEGGAAEADPGAAAE